MTQHPWGLGRHQSYRQLPPLLATTPSATATVAADAGRAWMQTSNPRPMSQLKCLQRWSAACRRALQHHDKRR